MRATTAWIVALCIAGALGRQATLPADGPIPSAVLEAAAGGHGRVLERLLREGGDESVLSALVAVPNHNFEAVGLVHIGGLNGHVATVKAVVEAGGNVALAAGDGATVLDAAVQEKHVELVRWLCKAGTRRARVLARAPPRRSGFSPLHLAAENGDEDIVRALLGAGVKLNVKNNGITPAFAAALKGHTAVLELLLVAGANPNYGRAASGATLLHAAVSSNSSATVRLALHHGANPNVAMDKGITPLHVAAEIGRPDVVAALLGSPRIVANATSDAGLTALDYAAATGNADVIDLLVAAGVSGNVKATHVKASFARTLAKLGLGTFGVFIAPLLCCKAVRSSVLASAQPAISSRIAHIRAQTAAAAARNAAAAAEAAAAAATTDNAKSGKKRKKRRR